MSRLAPLTTHMHTHTTHTQHSTHTHTHTPHAHTHDTAHIHTHIRLYCQSQQCIRIWGRTRQLAYPVNLQTLILDISSVSFLHSHLYFLQFHRKCELSTSCDGGELRDHILLPTSICPVTRVSAATQQGSALTPTACTFQMETAVRHSRPSEGFLNRP